VIVAVKTVALTAAHPVTVPLETETSDCVKVPATSSDSVNLIPNALLTGAVDTGFRATVTVGLVTSVKVMATVFAEVTPPTAKDRVPFPEASLDVNVIV
jgi:hypothetical protein